MSVMKKIYTSPELSFNAVILVDVLSTSFNTDNDNTDVDFGDFSDTDNSYVDFGDFSDSDNSTVDFGDFFSSDNSSIDYGDFF